MPLGVPWAPQHPFSVFMLFPFMNGLSGRVTGIRFKFCIALAAVVTKISVWTSGNPDEEWDGIERDLDLPLV